MKPRFVASIRRLAAKGWGDRSIASAYGLAVGDVRRILRPAPPPPPRSRPRAAPPPPPPARPRAAPPPPKPARPAPAPPDPARAIRGILARHVRQRHAAGETAATIAAALSLDLVAVERFLAPPPAPPRPRPVRPVRPSRHWGGWHEDAPELVAAAPSEPAICPAEVLAEPLVPMPPARASTWSPGPYQEVPGRRPVLDSAQAAEVRELAREGWSRPELAARFGVSRSTIDSAIAGRLVTRPAPAGD